MQVIDLAYRAREYEAEGAHPSMALIRSMQIGQGGEACYLTDKRLYCQEYGCEWRKECCRLVAVWRR